MSIPLARIIDPRIRRDLYFRTLNRTKYKYCLFDAVYYHTKVWKTIVIDMCYYGGLFSGYLRFNIRNSPRVDYTTRMPVKWE